MAVCGDRVCKARLKACCGSLIANVCGSRGLVFPKASCSAIRFEGVGDVTINQGEDFDLREGVHAYDGNGNEIDFTVTPNEIDTCTVGEYVVTYSATGIGDSLLPSVCLGTPMLHIMECGMTEGRAYRTITVKSYAVVCESTLCCSSAIC